ncbi:MAG: hypothetical protein JOZ05_07285 [Acetobacteraceae bacterium]|nr:hypothetical protein [Acetobacteraceae bacterium]
MIFERRYDGVWRPWFAWHPVRLPDEETDGAVVVRHAWLRWVERRRARFALPGETVISYRLHAEEPTRAGSRLRARVPDRRPVPDPKHAEGMARWSGPLPDGLRDRPRARADLLSAAED